MMIGTFNISPIVKSIFFRVGVIMAAKAVSRIFFGEKYNCFDFYQVVQSKVSSIK